MAPYFWLALLLLAVAFLLRVDFIYYILYVLIGVFLWSRWSTPRALRHLIASRTYNRRAFLGEPVEVTLTLSNKSRLALPWIQFNESVPPELRVEESTQQVISLSGRGTRTYTYHVKGLQRGYYQLGPLRLTGGDLFGLARPRLGYLPPDYLTVYPRIVPLSRLGLPSRLPFGTIGSHQRLFEDPARPMGARDFRSGDSQRQINWKATAHTQRLLVRTFEPAISLETMLLLDLHAPDYERRDRLYWTEWAIVVAASLATHLVNQRQAVGLMSNGVDPLRLQEEARQFDDVTGRLLFRPETAGQNLRAYMPPPIEPRAGRPHLMKILEQLARLDPRATLPLHEWAATAGVRLSWGVTIVAITGQGDEPRCNALHRLARAGFNPILVAVEPDANFSHVRERARRLGFRAYNISNRADLGSLAGGQRPAGRSRAVSNRRPRLIRNKGVIAAARVQRVPAPGPRLPFQTDALTRRFVRPPLIAALATAPAIGLLVLATILSPDEAWLRLAWFCFFAALEGAYTAAWLNNPDSRGVDRMTYRAAEVFLLVALSRIVSWALFGGGLPSPEEMRVYLAAPLSFFLTGGFFTTTFVTLVAWYLAVTIGRIFAQMDVGVEEVQFYTLATAEQKAQADNRPIPIGRGELQERYLRLWLTGGMVMVLMAALSTFEVAEFATVESVLAITRLGLRPAMLFALLLYFLAGLWLLSHARLLRLNAQWLADGVGKDAGLERSWQRSSLTLLLLIALGAAFLPIGSTLGISHILRLALNALLYVVGLIYSVIGFLFAATLTFLTRNTEQTILPTPQPMPTPAPPPVAPPPAAPNPTLAFIVSSAFWALLIALAIGALLYFLRERGYRLEIEQVRRGATTLSQRLRELWLRLRRRARLARYTLRQRLRGPATPVDDSALPGTGLRLSRPRGMSPREQIRYYYLSTVHRAGERGVPRAENETPLEYAHDLKEQWPEAGSELDELTQAFVEARYSPQPIERSAVARVKEEWKRIRERLRSSTHRS